MERTTRIAGISLLAALALGVGDMAMAANVVLTPMVPNGADEKKVMNIFQLMSSELEFMPMVDSVQEASPRPASLTTDCVSNPGCLGSIASAHGGDSVFTGVLTDQGASLVMDLVYFEGGQIKRRKAFNVSSNATQIANAMTDIINEMMTGVAADAQAAAAPSSDDFSSALDDEDDFFTNTPAPAPSGGGFDGLVDAGPSAAELAYQQQQEQARRAADEQARQAAADQARRQAEEQARRRAEEEARRRAEEEARQRAEAEARHRAEEEAQRRAAEEARRQAEEQARRQEQARQLAAQQEQARQLAAQEEIERKRRENQRREQEEAARRAAANSAISSAPAPNMADINFGPAADQISSEDINSVISFGAPTQPAPATSYNPASYAPPTQPAYTPPPQPTYTPPAPQPSYGSNPGYGNAGYGAAPADLALEEQELAAMGEDGIIDLDDDGKKRNRNKGSGRAGSTTTLDRATPKTLQLTVRGGYSRYFSFNFVTAGLEVGVPLGKGLMAVAGLESYSVQRELPPGAQVPGEPIFQWNTIYPMNMGLTYKFNTGTLFVPYVGADMIFVQYFKDEVGADWAGGARARGGVDIMVVENFGLNANIAVGGWTGKNWTLIEPTLGNSGLLPQINAGTVVAF